MALRTAQLPLPTIEDPVWSDDHLVLFFRLSFDSIERHVLTDRTFPKPARIGESRRWSPTAVRCWWGDTTEAANATGKRARITAAGVGTRG